MASRRATKFKSVLNPNRRNPLLIVLPGPDQQDCMYALMLASGTYIGNLIGHQIHCSKLTTATDQNDTFMLKHAPEFVNTPGQTSIKTVLNTASTQLNPDYNRAQMDRYRRQGELAKVQTLASDQTADQEMKCAARPPVQWHS